MAADKGAFDATFKQLRDILKPYAERMVVQADTSKLYSLGLRDVQDRIGRPLFFGSVRKGKAYVSYHLMAVYASPELLDGLSPELRKRMQGKSCFNFTDIDPTHLKELTALTAKSVKRFNKKTLQNIVPW